MGNGTTTFSLMELFRMGGAFMWPLLVFSMLTVAIALERAIFFLYHNLQFDDLKDVVLERLRANDAAGAKRFLEGINPRRLGARILLALVNKAQLVRASDRKSGGGGGNKLHQLAGKRL